MIAFTALIPSSFGMTMSIVMRSGFVALYCSTASTPFAASPTISYPLSTKIVLIIARMMAASSAINTLLPIAFVSGPCAQGYPSRRSP